MIHLYNKEKLKIAGIIDYKNLTIEKELESGEKTLSFSYPKTSKFYFDIEEECYIRTKEDEFIVKEKSVNDEFADFKCILNLEDLEGKPWERYTSEEQTIQSALNLALAGTGWIVGKCSLKKKRTVRKSNCSSLEIIKEIRKIYRCDIVFNTISKTIDIYESLGEDKGSYFIDSLNLKTLSTQGNTYDYFTRIIPIGKDGLRISKINNGKDYVENYQYSRKVKTCYWIDERYTIIENLKEDAEAKLNEISKPYRSFSADIINLAKLNKKYKNVLDFKLGDTIYLISKNDKFRDRQRIVKIIEHPDEHELDTVELANTKLSFEDIQTQFQDTSDTVDNITTDNGTVDGSTVDEIETNQIKDFDSEVVRVSNIEAINGKIHNLEASYVTVTGELTSVKARIGDLSANVATIDKLTVTHSASINELQATKASITQLETVNASIKVLETNVGKIDTLLNGNLSSENIQAGGITSDKLTIENGFIKNAMIDSLDVSKVNAGDIITNKFRIKSDDGGIEIVGATQQFKDKNNKVRIQMGKDAKGNFNFIIRGEDGTTTLIDHNGIKQKAIADDLIISNMIASDSIGEKQINYSSFTNGFNKDSNTSTLKATKIKLDNQNQTLELAFNNLKTQSDGIKSLTESNSTTINVMQGKINTAINNTQIIKDGQTILLKDDYNRTVATVDSMKSTISSHSSKIDATNGKLNNVESKTNELERSLSSFSSRLSSTETTITSHTNFLNAVDGKINNAKSQAIVDARKSPDTRDKNENPAWYFSNYPRQIISEFKYGNIVGVTSSNIYGTVTTNVPWNDKSGGYPVQTWKSNSTATFERVGTSDTTWGEWKQIEDTAGSQNKANSALNNSKNYTNGEINKVNISITTTNNRVSSIEQNLSSITSKVISVETTTANINGQVVNLSTRMSSAEQKITSDAIVSVVKNHQTNGQSTFVTESILEQTKDDFNFKFSTSASPNLIGNGKPTVENTCGWNVTDGASWYKNVPPTNAIGIANTNPREGYAWSEFIKVVPGKTYTVCVDIVAEGNTLGADTFVIGSKDTSGDYSQIVHFMAIESGQSRQWRVFIVSPGINYLRIRIDNNGYKGNQPLGGFVVWINEAMLLEGAIPNPNYRGSSNQIANNITTIDSEGVKIRHSNGSKSEFTHEAIDFYNSSGARTLRIKDGGLNFHCWSPQELVGFIKPSIIVGQSGHNGVTLSTYSNGDYITLGHTSSNDENVWSSEPYLIVSQGSFGRHKGVSIVNHPFLCETEAQFLQYTRFMSSILVETGGPYSNMIFTSANSHKGLCMFGDNRVVVGIREGAENKTCWEIAEDGSQVSRGFGHNWVSWDWHGYRISNVNMTRTLAPQSFALRSVRKTINDTYSITSLTDGEVRFVCRTEQVITPLSVDIENKSINEKGKKTLIVEIPQLLAENIDNDYHINICKMSWGDYRIIEKNPYYFEIETNVDNFRFTFEIAAKLHDKAQGNISIAKSQYLKQGEPKQKEARKITTQVF